MEFGHQPNSEPLAFIISTLLGKKQEEGAQASWAQASWAQAEWDFSLKNWGGNN